MNVIAVTGHRPDKLGGYSRAVFIELVNLAKHHLVEHQPDEVITGMALGWDQAVAEACRQLNIPFIAAIPFKGQESMWPRESRAYYRELLSCAKEVVEVSPPGYAAWKMLRRNEWMVCRATRVLALWNGTSGGTANAVAYAHELEIPVTNLWTSYYRMKNNPQGEDL